MAEWTRELTCENSAVVGIAIVGKAVVGFNCTGGVGCWAKQPENYDLTWSEEAQNAETDDCG